MSIERKDVRAKLDPDMHRALQILAGARCQTDAELIEEILVPVIRQRLHEASLIHAQATVAGITGNFREKQGTGGRGRE